MNFNEIIDELKISIAMDDSDSITMMNRAANTAILAAALLFEPPELRTSAPAVADDLGTAINLASSLLRNLRVEEVYNATGSQKVWPLGFHQLETFHLPTSGNVLYYALYGNNMYYRPYSNDTLTIYYFQYPARLSGSEALPFDLHQDYIITFANAYVWATKEELEDVDMWQKIGQMTQTPLDVMTRTRQLMFKEKTLGNYVQGTIQTSPAQA